MKVAEMKLPWFWIQNERRSTFKINEYIKGRRTYTYIFVKFHPFFDTCWNIDVQTLQPNHIHTIPKKSGRPTTKTHRQIFIWNTKSQDGWSNICRTVMWLQNMNWMRSVSRNAGFGSNLKQGQWGPGSMGHGLVSSFAQIFSVLIHIKRKSIL